MFTFVETIAGYLFHTKTITNTRDKQIHEYSRMSQIMYSVFSVKSQQQLLISCTLSCFVSEHARRGGLFKEVLLSMYW